MEREPLESLDSITEPAILAVPVTVSVVPLIVQFVPDVPVWPVEEMLKFCVEPIKEKQTKINTKLNLGNISCILDGKFNQVVWKTNL